MKILLLNPINRSSVIIPSLGLGYLAAILLSKGHDVSVLNCMKERITYDSFTNYIQQNRFDVIGFQIFSYDINSVKRHVEIIRNCSTATTIIAGGPHPSGDPVGTMKCIEGIDFAFQGEAEKGLPMLIDHIHQGIHDLDSIPGLIWKSDDGIKVNPKYIVKYLDSIEFPAWDLIKPESYPEAPHGAFTKTFPTAPIITSRGCPNLCTFCAGSSINGRIVRRRSIGNVMQELHLLKKRGIKEFHIEDENFTLLEEYVRDFCAILKEEKMDMSWSLPSGVRLDTLNRDLLQTMANAGCYSLAVGIEFGTDRILKLTRKGITVNAIREQMQIFAGIPIKVTGFFLFGIPGETCEEIMQTSYFSRQLPLDRAQFNIFAPLPGCAEWERLRQQGLLEQLDTGKLYLNDVSYVEGDVTPKKLRRIQRHAFLSFYLRPRILLNVIFEIRTVKHLKFIIKRLIDTLYR